jgi:hypothetical protein
MDCTFPVLFQGRRAKCVPLLISLYQTVSVLRLVKQWTLQACILIFAVGKENQEITDSELKCSVRFVTVTVSATLRHQSDPLCTGE